MTFAGATYLKLLSTIGIDEQQTAKASFKLAAGVEFPKQLFPDGYGAKAMQRGNDPLQPGAIYLFSCLVSASIRVENYRIGRRFLLVCKMLINSNHYI